MKRHICHYKAVILLILATLVPFKAYATITITPTIVVFEGRERYKDVTLINTSNEQKTYEIGWRFYRMANEGLAPYQGVDSALTEFDLSKNMVFTPRRVTLAPGGKQKIKLALRRTAEVPPGEHRAHLEFRAVPEEDLRANERGGQRDESPQGERMSAGVRINVGFSIPVVFNAGEPQVQAELKLLSLDRNPQSGAIEALVEVKRTGGPYGILGHLFIYNAQGEIAGEVGNANIFAEADQRLFRVPLKAEKVLPGELRLVLAYYDKSAGKPPYASITVPIQ